MSQVFLKTSSYRSPKDKGSLREEPVLNRCNISFAPIGRSGIFRFGLTRASCGVLSKLT